MCFLSSFRVRRFGAVVLLPLALAACADDADDPSGDTGTGGAERGSGSEAAGTGGDDESVGGGGGAGGSDVAPVAYGYVEVVDGVAELRFTSEAGTCGVEPDLTECTAYDRYDLQVKMPVERLVVGTYGLQEPGIFSFGSYRWPAEPDGTCNWGGGVDGSFSIFEVTPDHVLVRVSSTLGALEGPTTYDFELERCGDLVVPTGAPLATRAQSLTVEQEYDDGEDYYDLTAIQITDRDAASCEGSWTDTWGLEECARSYAISVNVEPYDVVAGKVIDLAYVKHQEVLRAPDGDSCWEHFEDGPLTGTLTFDAVDAETMTVTFAGTANAYLDGTHVVDVCPADTF